MVPFHLILQGWAVVGQVTPPSDLRLQGLEKHRSEAPVQMRCFARALSPQWWHL